MTRTMQMRTTQEQSGDYQVYATATVNGEQPIKGLAVHESAAEQVGDWVEAELVPADEADVTITPEKFTGATGRYSTDGPAIRHVYLSQEFMSEFDEFDAEELAAGTTDGLPPEIGIRIRPSTEEAYEEQKAERQDEVAEDADEQADALVAGTDESDDEDDEPDAEEQAEALVGEAENEEEVEIADEEIGIE